MVASVAYNPFLVSHTSLTSNSMAHLITYTIPISHPKTTFVSASMDLILQRPNCPTFQTSYGGLGSRFVHVHGRTWHKNTIDHTKVNLHAKKLSAKAVAGDGGDELRPSETERSAKLRSAIQNRSVKELIKLIGDECKYLLNSIRPTDVSRLSVKGAFLLFHALMLRHNVSFVIKPAEDAGFDLGVKWSLGKGCKLPWDLSCDISTAHVYRGLLLISQVNKAFGSLLRSLLLLIQQNLDATIFTLTNKVLPEGMLEENKSSTAIICAGVGLGVMLLFYALFKHIHV